MNNIERVETLRSARRAKAAAKLVLLRGQGVAAGLFQGMTLMLEGMRIYLASAVGYPRLFLVPVPGGYALYLRISHGPLVWLIAERSKKVRIFKCAETAFAVCKKLESPQVSVLLDQHVPAGISLTPAVPYSIA